MEAANPAPSPRRPRAAESRLPRARSRSPLLRRPARWWRRRREQPPGSPAQGLARRRVAAAALVRTRALPGRERVRRMRLQSRLNNGTCRRFDRQGPADSRHGPAGYSAGAIQSKAILHSLRSTAA